MTRNIKLCISLLLALFLTFTVSIGVLADPDDPQDPSTSSGENNDPSESSPGEPTDQCTVTVQVANAQVYFNGSDTPGTQTSVNKGSSLTLRVVPDPGYQVVGVTMNGLPLPGSAGTYTLGSVMSSCILVVEVVPDGTATEDPSGSSDPSDPSDPGDVQLWPVTVVIHGAGSVTVNGTPIANDGSATVTQTVMVPDTVQLGEKAQFLIRPAAGCRLGRIVIDGMDYGTAQLDFRSQITEPTTMEITFVSEEELPSTFPVTITVSEGGYVSANGQEVLGGSTTTIHVETGKSVNLWLNPEPGYELGALTVDGNAQHIKSGSFTLQNIVKAVQIKVDFKKKEAAKPVQVSDLDWTPKSDNCIHLDFTSNDYVSKAVFDWINTLSNTDGDYVVLETAQIRWYVPCGKRVEGVAADFYFSVMTGMNAPYYNIISDALLGDADPNNDVFNFYQLTEAPVFPEGTKVSFQMMALADMYSGRNVKLMVREAQNGEWKLNAVGEGEIKADGWTSLMDFRNSSHMVVIVQSATEQPDTSVSAPSFGESSEAEPAGKSYAGLIVALVIAFVAVGGAAALFIVKWRQEKF